MTDLSYTDKDGLNPAAGFINVYNYHKDGNEGGEGYATGGYPEITGETSSLPSKNYKTGDNPDFFNNGNVWEQEQPEPGPTPTEGYTATLRPIMSSFTTGTMNSNWLAVTDVNISGTFIPLVANDTYTVVYDGVPYENQTIKSITYGNDTTMLCLGNLDAFFLRTGEALFGIRDTMISQLTDSDLSFAILQHGDDNEYILPMFLDTVSADHVISVTRTSDSASYTMTFTSNELSLQILSVYCPVDIIEDLSTFVEEYGIEDKKRAKVILNNEEVNGTWTAVTQQGTSMGTWFIPDGYEPPTSIADLSTLDYPVTAIYGINNGILFATVVNADKINTLTLLKSEADDSGNDDSGSDDDTGKSLTISGTFVNDDVVKGPAVSDEDFAILVNNNGKIANVNYNGTTHQAMVSYSENNGGGIDFYFASDDNLGTHLWLYAEDGSEDTTRYLQAAKENGTVGEEEFTISIDLENFTEDAGGGGGDIGR